MKNTGRNFSKGLRVLSIVGLFGLVLGSLFTPFSRINADTVPAAVSITASPGSICSGQSVHLQWTSENAEVSISPGIGPVDPYGDRYVTPSQTTTYTITGTNSTGGYGQATAHVTVTGPCTQPPQDPTVTLSANPSSVDYGDSSVVSWSSTNATSCSAMGGTGGWPGLKATSGFFTTGSLFNTTTFSITCSNSSGSDSDSETINVGSQEQNPSVDLSANPTSVNFGGSSVLTWDSDNATSCTASGGRNGWSGSRIPFGTFNTRAFTNIS